MNFLSDWVTKIILFMLIGTVIELLLPSNTMKKYVHFIFGLLFLLLLAQPIFFIFQTDISEQIAAIEGQLEQDRGSLEKTNITIQKQKEDIQAEHAAYIWNELKAHYIEQANPVLRSKHKIMITDLSLIHDERDNETLDELARLIVFLDQEEEEERLTTIKAIEITNESSRQDYSNLPNAQVITEALRDIWQLDEEIMIELRWKEGQVD